MIIPNNIQKIFDDARCLICQSHLADLNTMPVNWMYPYDEIEHEDEIGYLTDAYCNEIPEHYRLSLEWSYQFLEPIVRCDALELYTSEYQYELSITRNHNVKIETSIIARPLNEDGHITDEKPSHSLELFEDCFDLSNFNEQCYIEKVETLMLFK